MKFYSKLHASFSRYSDLRHNIACLWILVHMHVQTVLLRSRPMSFVFKTAAEAYHDASALSAKTPFPDS